MGQGIFYCAKCAIRILSGDLEKGKAFLIGHQAFCRQCAPPDAKRAAEEVLISGRTPRGGTTLPAPTPRDPFPAVVPRGSARDSGPSSKTRRAIAAAVPGRSRPASWILWLGLGFALVLIVIAVGSRGGSPPPPPSAPPAASPALPGPAAETPSTRAARQAWERACAYMKEHPDHLGGQIDAFEKALPEARGTPYFEKIREALDALHRRRQDAINQEMARLDAEVHPLLQREEFKGAMDLYERARSRRADPEWPSMIDGRVQEIRNTALRLLETVREGVVEGLRSGADGVEAKARERVARWGLPPMAAELETFLSGPGRERRIVQGLVGWWKLNEGTGATVEDASGGGRRGTLGDGVQWVEGRKGKALSFDGDRARVQIQPFYETVRDTFTLVLWAFPRAEMRITPEATSGAPPLNGHRFAIFPTHGNHFGPGHAGVGLSIGTNGIAVFEHADRHFPSILVHQAPIQGWTHVALVVLDRVPTLFLNGERVRTGLKSTRTLHPSCQLGGGTERYGTYEGLLEDVRIYDRGLTEIEIRLLAGTTERPWQRIFDGMTNECLRANCRSSWIVEREGLTRTGPPNAAQTVEEFEDGEIRARFELEGPEAFVFCVRQGDAGRYYVKWDSTNSIQSLEGKPHDLVFTCRGESVTATLDGSPVEVKSVGNPRRGCLQFNGSGRVVRILSIEFRPLP